MAKHLNAFQGLINRTTSMEVPLADEVLALLLLGSLPNCWETLMVTLCHAGSQGKQLSLEMVKSSLLNEEAHRKDRESISDHTVLVTDGDSNKGRGRQRNLQKQGQVQTEVEVKGNAHVLLLWVVGTLPEEL